MSLILKFKQKISTFLGKYSRNGKMAFALSYIHNRGKLPNFKNPKDLSEIWISKVINEDYNIIYFLADKYAVRQYIKNNGLGDILVPLIGVYSNIDEIDFKSLPNKFALKANYGSGMNFICRNKKDITEQELKSIARNWLQNSSFNYMERHYNLIEKRIVCEDYIDDGTGGLPIDYKFMCINGRVASVLVCCNRSEDDNEAEYLPYSVNWEPQYDYYRNVDKNYSLAEKPANFNEMLSIAEKLAEKIDLIRVDLYSNGKQIWFGEMTLTPAGCIFKRWTNKAMKELGQIYLQS